MILMAPLPDSKIASRCAASEPRSDQVGLHEGLGVGSFVASHKVQI
jgi:hypothetical protein